MKFNLKKKTKRISKHFEELLSYNSCLINNNQTVILPGVLKKISCFNPGLIVRNNEIELVFSYNTNKYNTNFLKKIEKRNIFHKIANFFRNDKIIVKTFSFEESIYKETIYDKIKIKDIHVLENTTNYKKISIILSFKNTSINENEINSYFKIRNNTTLNEIEKYSEVMRNYEKIYETDIS